MRIKSGATASLWAECLYIIGDAQNRVARPWCAMRPKELLTAVKPSVEHLQSFGCRVWARVPDKTRKSLHPKAKINYSIVLSVIWKMPHYARRWPDCQGNSSLPGLGTCVSDENGKTMLGFYWTNLKEHFQTILVKSCLITQLQTIMYRLRKVKDTEDTLKMKTASVTAHLLCCMNKLIVKSMQERKTPMRLKRLGLLPGGLDELEGRPFIS